MTGYFISIVNLKGGTGKTTIATLLAYSLTRLNPNYKVALIDLDPQASATSAFFRKFEFEKHLGHYIGLVERRRMKLIPPEDDLGVNDRLRIFPSNTVVFTDVWTLSWAPPRAETIANWLKTEPSLRNFDFVIIDCPPDAYFARMGVKASDAIIIPTDTTAISIHGTKQFIERIYRHEIISEHLKIKLLGVLFNKVRFMKGKIVEHDARAVNDMKEFIYKIIERDTLLRNYIYENPIFNTKIPMRKNILGDLAIFMRDKRHKCRIIKAYESMRSYFDNLAREVVDRLKHFRGVAI